MTPQRAQSHEQMVYKISRASEWEEMGKPVSLPVPLTTGAMVISTSHRGQVRTTCDKWFKVKTIFCW